MLRAGLPVKDKHIVFSDGREFITTLQANVEKRGPEFVPGTTRSVKKEQAQENKEEQRRHKEKTGGRQDAPQHVGERGRQHPFHQQVE